MNERFFVSDVSKWRSAGDSIQKLIGEATAEKHCNAIVLPPRKIEAIKAFNGVYEGGVCDERFKFLAGHIRSMSNKKENWCCASSYRPEGEVIRRHESVIFGGVVFRHFGHALLDTTSRLWYVARNLGDTRKIVFLDYGWPFADPFDFFQLFDLMGISRDRIEIVSQPTQFDEVVIPEEAIHPLSGEYKPEYMETFDLIRRNAAPSSVKKVYFTRSSFRKQDCLNERYFEEFYQRRGFKVFSPEQLSFEEQISLVAGADEFVASVGTMTHLLLFAQPSVKATILNRSTDCVRPQLVVDNVKGIRPYYVEAVRNVLPTRHTAGAFLFAPNRFFRRYLEETGQAFDESELELGPDFPLLVSEYLAMWFHAYSSGRASMLKEQTMSSVIQSVGSALLDVDSFSEEYAEANLITPLKKEVASLKSENKKLKKELEAMRNSKSWRATAWIRRLSKLMGKG